MRTQTKNLPWVFPSLLAADFSCLGKEVQEVEKAGAHGFHIDVMDGHFVPNLTLGPLGVSAIRSHTQLPLDCHLMVSHPQDWIEPFARAGAQMITVHAESTAHLHRVISKIQGLGCQAGVSLNPASPLCLIEEVLEQVDLILLMSVDPGLGGQKFIESSYDKVKRLACLRGEYSFLIEVDGGISAQNAGKLRQAGADIFVVGSALFSSSDREKTIHDIKTASKN